MIDFTKGYLYTQASTPEKSRVIGPVSGVFYDPQKGELNFYGPDDRGHSILGSLSQDKDTLSIDNEDGSHILRPLRLSDMKGLMLNAPHALMISWECDAQLWEYVSQFVPSYWRSFRDSLT